MIGDQLFHLQKMLYQLVYRLADGEHFSCNLQKNHVLVLDLGTITAAQFYFYIAAEIFVCTM